MLASGLDDADQGLLGSVLASGLDDADQGLLGSHTSAVDLSVGAPPSFAWFLF